MMSEYKRKRILGDDAYIISSTNKVVIENKIISCDY